MGGFREFSGRSKSSFWKSCLFLFWGVFVFFFFLFGFWTGPTSPNPSFLFGSVLLCFFIFFVFGGVGKAIFLQWYWSFEFFFFPKHLYSNVGFGAFYSSFSSCSTFLIFLPLLLFSSLSIFHLLASPSSSLASIFLSHSLFLILLLVLFFSSLLASFCSNPFLTPPLFQSQCFLTFLSFVLLSLSLLDVLFVVSGKNIICQS